MDNGVCLTPDDIRKKRMKASENLNKVNERLESLRSWVMLFGIGTLIISALISYFIIKENTMAYVMILLGFSIVLSTKRLISLGGNKYVIIITFSLYTFLFWSIFTPVWYFSSGVTIASLFIIIFFIIGEYKQEMERDIKYYTREIDELYKQEIEKDYKSL